MKHLPIIARAVRHADRIAVRTKSGQCSYNDLLRRAKTIAANLLQTTRDLDESPVAFLMPAGPDYISTQWGIWQAGGIAVPLSLSATEKELEYTLGDSESRVVVVTGELAAGIAGICQSRNLRLVIADEPEKEEPVKLPEIHPDRRAMILYTSGTTSKPKGVVTTHICIQAQIEALIEAWHWHMDDRIPLFLPLHHIHGIINIMSCALWSGAEIEAFPRFEMDTILHRVAERAWSVFMAVPTIYVKLIASLESMTATDRAAIVDGFGGMRLMISGSAALPASIHEQWTELTGQQLLERYGMTEIGMAVSNPYIGERRAGTVGQPLPGVEVRLVSEQSQIVTEENVTGEIQVRGANVFLEYWNRAEATHKYFHEGWFRTGDIAVLENGYYRIMGRSSVDIIKSGGYKLSALEIEATLLDHPAIFECAVVGVPDETWGEAVAVAVGLQAGSTLELESLRSWCRERISAYKIPHRLLIVKKLPRNSMGKVTKPDVQTLFRG